MYSSLKKCRVIIYWGSPIIWLTNHQYSNSMRALNPFPIHLCLSLTLHLMWDYFDFPPPFLSLIYAWCKLLVVGNSSHLNTHILYRWWRVNCGQKKKPLVLPHFYANGTSQYKFSSSSSYFLHHLYVWESSQPFLFHFRCCWSLFIVPCVCICI